jgi:VWFA-related protein
MVELPQRASAAHARSGQCDVSRGRERRHTVRTRNALLALALVNTVSLSAQQPTFSSRLEVVRLDILVTDDGKPIRDLAASEFEVFDNGVRQHVDFVGFEKIPLGVVLTLDVSASVRGGALSHLREAGEAVLDALNVGEESALITFTEGLTQEAALTPDIDQVRSALALVEPSGDTALRDGAYAGINVADGAAGRGLVIVFSDGSDTASWLSERAVIDAARRANATVYAVSAATRNASFLKELTSATGGRLYELESTRDLRAVFLSALEEFRHRYLVSYTPSGVEKDGWHDVEVRVKRRGATVRARPGYLGGS